MVENNKNVPYHTIAAVLFSLLGVSSLLAVLDGSIISLLWVAAYGLSAFALFQQKRDIFLPAGLGLLAVLSLYTFLTAFGTESYSVYVWSYRYGSDFEFNFLCVLPALLKLLGTAALALLAVCTMTDYLPQYREKVVRFWYLPVALLAGSMVLALVIYILLAITGSGEWVAFHTNLSLNRLLLTAAFGCTSVWLVPEGLSSLPRSSQSGDGYYSIVKHTLLLVFTCGIWYCIWIYRVTGYLNRATGDDRNPVTKLLLCLFVPCYLPYWIYKSCLCLDKLSVENGMFANLTTICTLMSMILPILPPILMQDRINAIVTANMFSAFEEV